MSTIMNLIKLVFLTMLVIVISFGCATTYSKRSYFNEEENKVFSETHWEKGIRCHIYVNNIVKGTKPSSLVVNVIDKSKANQGEYSINIDKLGSLMKSSLNKDIQVHESPNGPYYYILDVDIIESRVDTVLRNRVNYLFIAGRIKDSTQNNIAIFEVNHGPLQETRGAIDIIIKSSTDPADKKVAESIRVIIQKIMKIT